MKLNSKGEAEKLLKRILHLSYRISRLSPPMKPFVRFSADRGDDQQWKVFHSRFFWDFDDLLQKRLLNLAYEIASPATIVQACVEQWKVNLQALCARRSKELEQAKRSGAEYAFTFHRRTQFIAERIRPGNRFLYIGCGSGTQCFLLAKKGLRVVGIDTIASLLGVAKDWAAYLELPDLFVCMDVMELGFEPGSFDSFLLEFYGALPSSSQVLALQNGLSNILNSEGSGFIIAERKKYSSYWFMMGTPYPQPMVNWLAPQERFDFLFSEADACEEKLFYGLYKRSHTLQSLSCELSKTFEVSECLYESDPRYIIAVVKRKESSKYHNIIDGRQTNAISEKVVTSLSLSEVSQTVRKIEVVCDQLEAHAERVTNFFEDSEKSSANNCLRSVSTDILGFIDLLEGAVAPNDGGVASQSARLVR